MIEVMNTRALSAALMALVGEKKAEEIRSLYVALNSLEDQVRKEGYASGYTVAEAEADDDCEIEYRNGYDKGYADARNAFYSDRQPETVMYLPDLSESETGFDEERRAIANAIMDIDPSKLGVFKETPHQDDSRDEMRLAEDELRRKSIHANLRGKE